MIIDHKYPQTSSKMEEQLKKSVLENNQKQQYRDKNEREKLLKDILNVGYVSKNNIPLSVDTISEFGEKMKIDKAKYTSATRSPVG